LTDLQHIIKLKELILSANSTATYEKLVLIIGKHGAGKTKLLRKFANENNIPVHNLSLFVAENILTAPNNDRSNLIMPLLRGWIKSYQLPHPFVIDNIEILFEPSLKIDPLKMLKDISKEKCIVASWTGSYTDKLLTYAEQGHPQYYTSKASDLHLLNI
jgi:hypothetical protein